MKTPLIALTLLLTLTVSAYAQQRGTGLDFNPNAFKVVPTFSEQGEKSLVPLPMVADLTPYAPLIGDQGRTPSCVAWSTAYAAFTVQYAAQKKIRDRNEIQRIALSAMWPYLQLRPNCDRGVDLPTVAEHIRTNGNVSFAEFGLVNCGIPVSGELTNRARQNRPIKEVVRLFDETSSKADKIYRTREQIGRFNTPVIVGVHITKRFVGLKDELYRPEGDVIELHAMTVVGYDGISFKIMNSWGTGWGKEGYFSIRFEDFANITVGGVVLVLPDSYTPGPVPTTTTTTTQIGGTFAFQYYDPNGQFQRVSPQHRGNGVYDLARKDWQVNQQFQLLTQNSRQAQHMWVFSIDTDNVVHLHWPIACELSELGFGMGTKPVTDILPKPGIDLVIPANDDQGRPQALTIQKAGTDYLCVFYSDKPLREDLYQILNRVRTTPGDIYSRLQTALGNRLVPASAIRYESNQMGASTATTKGYVIPLVLKVESAN